jgi:hypothetical protein
LRIVEWRLWCSGGFVHGVARSLVPRLCEGLARQEWTYLHRIKSSYCPARRWLSGAPSWGTREFQFHWYAAVSWQVLRHRAYGWHGAALRWDAVAAGRCRKFYFKRGCGTADALYCHQRFGALAAHSAIRQLDLSLA